MKNAGLTIGMCAIGLGLASIGFNLNGNQANATPGAFAPAAGPAEPTIVWYQSVEDWGQGGGYGNNDLLVLRAWSNGTIEGRWIEVYDVSPHCFGIRDAADCSNLHGWFVISSPNEGLNALADINFDERVDAADLGLLVAAWGDAPRNDYPPSDCPLGLIP